MSLYKVAITLEAIWFPESLIDINMGGVNMINSFVTDGWVMSK